MFLYLSGEHAHRLCWIISDPWSFSILCIQRPDAAVTPSPTLVTCWLFSFGISSRWPLVQSCLGVLLRLPRLLLNRVRPSVSDCWPFRDIITTASVRATTLFAKRAPVIAYYVVRAFVHTCKFTTSTIRPAGGYFTVNMNFHKPEFILKM